MPDDRICGLNAVTALFARRPDSLVRLFYDDAHKIAAGPLCAEMARMHRPYRLLPDDEMVRAGLGPKTGRRMGHMSVSGPDGTLAAFEGLGVRRRVLLHINNSNPILLEDSPERAAVNAAGWEVAWDGMEVLV